MSSISDENLLARLANFEDHFVERKTASDKRDWLKTIVAFANSARTDFPGILYIGVRNDGEIETSQHDLDSLQKSLNTEMRVAYPPIVYEPRILRSGERQCLAVIVPSSEQRPHFAGPAYVRKGSETVSANEEQFGRLIALRNSKCFRISEYKGKWISVVNRQRSPHSSYETLWGDTVVVDCDQFSVTLDSGGTRQSFPLDDMTISFDPQNKRLKLIVAR